MCAGNLHIVKDSLSGYVLLNSPLATLMFLKGAFRLSDEVTNLLIYLSTFKIFCSYIKKKVTLNVFLHRNIFKTFRRESCINCNYGR